MNQQSAPVPPTPAPAAATAEEPLGFAALLELSIKLNGRIDTLWQRVIYAHGAMVGVMVFFASTDYPFVIPRLLVVFFYTMNSIVTYAAFRDAYGGLRAVVADIGAVGSHDSAVFAWARAQSFDMHARRRAAILVVLWGIITYLILGPLVAYWRIL